MVYDDGDHSTEICPNASSALLSSVVFLSSSDPAICCSFHIYPSRFGPGTLHVLKLWVSIQNINFKCCSPKSQNPKAMLPLYVEVPQSYRCTDICNTPVYRVDSPKMHKCWGKTSGPPGNFLILLDQVLTRPSLGITYRGAEFYLYISTFQLC